MKRTTAIIPIAALALCTALATPLRKHWDVDVSASPQTAQFAAYRGETVEFEARLRNGAWPFELPPSATATLHASTNGLDYWPWPASATTGGVVRATWLPSYDCGADAYRCFIRVADNGSNVIYRANFLLRLLGSPGEWPAGLPPPVRLIDFDEVAVTNAPWATPAQVASAIAGIDFPDETDPVFTHWAAEEGSEFAGTAAHANYATYATQAGSAAYLGDNDPISPRVVRDALDVLAAVSNRAYSAVASATSAVPGLVSNTVTKAFVEGLGIAGGSADGEAISNIVQDVASSATNYTDAVKEAIITNSIDAVTLTAFRLIVADLWRRVDTLEGADGSGYITAAQASALVDEAVADAVSLAGVTNNAPFVPIAGSYTMTTCTASPATVNLALVPNREHIVRYSGSGSSSSLSIDSLSCAAVGLPALLTISNFSVVSWPANATVSGTFSALNNNTYRVTKTSRGILCEKIQ